MPFDVSKLADTSFPYALLVIIAWMGSRLWRDIWPWAKEQLEKRFQAGLERERMLREQSTQFIKTLGDFRDGFTDSNAEQHREIIAAISELSNDLRQYRTANVALTELLIDRLEASKS